MPSRKPSKGLSVIDGEVLQHWGCKEVTQGAGGEPATAFLKKERGF